MVRKLSSKSLDIMKQNYISPTIRIVELHIESLLAASISDMPIKPDVPAVPASYEGSITKSSDEYWEHEW